MQYSKFFTNMSYKNESWLLSSKIRSFLLKNDTRKTQTQTHFGLSIGTSVNREGQGLVNMADRLGHPNSMCLINFVAYRALVRVSLDLSQSQYMSHETTD